MQLEPDIKNCLIPQEKVQLKRELAGPLLQLEDRPWSIATVQSKCKLMTWDSLAVGVWAMKTQ